MVLFLLNISLVGLVQWVLGAVLAVCLLMAYALGNEFAYHSLAWWSLIVLVAEAIHEGFFRWITSAVAKRSYQPDFSSEADETDHAWLRCAYYRSIARRLLYAPFLVGLGTFLPWIYLAFTTPGGGWALLLTPLGLLLILVGWLHLLRQPLVRTPA